MRRGRFYCPLLRLGGRVHCRERPVLAERIKAAQIFPIVKRGGASLHKGQYLNSYMIRPPPDFTGGPLYRHHRSVIIIIIRCFGEREVKPVIVLT
jgi:hypothetical protein